MAAELLKTDLGEVIRLGEKGELPLQYPKNVSMRMLVQTPRGKKEVTLREAAKLMGLPLKEVERQVAEGQLAAYYLPEHAEVQITTRWEYEKCFLSEEAGVCADYEEEGEIPWTLSP
jgi:hypothetical protein